MIRMKFKIFFLSLLASSALLAETELPEIRQVTTHPSWDGMGSVSPNGKWLAFTSDRSGNLDIWVKALQGREIIQITEHQAEDFDPVWAPDGKSLVFVSRRRDADGDLWRVQVDMKKKEVVRSKPEQLTFYLGADRDPSFSPNGKYLVYTSIHGDTANLWTINLKSKKSRQLTSFGAMEPAWSPDGRWIACTDLSTDIGGDIALLPASQGKEDSPNPSIQRLTVGPYLDGSPAWTMDGKSLIFKRIDTDSDQNGEITPEDRGGLWRIRVFSGEGTDATISFHEKLEFPLTSDLYDDLHPSCSKDSLLYFTSNRGQGWDIWRMPVSGLVPENSRNAAQLYGEVLVRFGGVTQKEALKQAYIGYERILSIYPEDTLYAARALIRMGEIQQVLGDSLKADALYGYVSEMITGQSMEKAQAEIKRISMDLVPLSSRIQRCQTVLSSSTRFPSILAEAYILLGDLYRKEKNYPLALQAYGQVIDRFQRQAHWHAQAQLRVGDLLQETGQTEAASAAYFSVLKQHERIRIWRQRATDRLMAQVRGDVNTRIAGYQAIIQNGQMFPVLQARAQLAIGETLYENGDYLRALAELKRVETLTPSEFWAHAEAAILQAKIYGILEDDLKGIALLEQVKEQYGDIEGGVYSLRADETLYDLYAQSAKRLLAYGDYQLAVKRYLKAIEIKPGEVDLHRGLVESSYRLGLIDEQIAWYRSKLDIHPQDPVLLYGLGLALSYAGEKDASRLRESNQTLYMALESDYRMIYPYRTLSYNFELMERMDEAEASKTSHGAMKVVRWVSSPFRWLYRQTPLHQSKKRAAYYEEAIQVLLTALELNREKEDPKMEAWLAQNLANNFYNLGEFSHRKAYQYYLYRLKYDSTFENTLQEAVFFERAGHSAMTVESFKDGERFLERSIRQYQSLGRISDRYLNEQRLAFLYTQDGRYEDAIDVYEQLMSENGPSKSKEEQIRNYRNIAYNYHLLDEPEDALEYADKALAFIDETKLKPKSAKKSYLKVETLGLSIPVWGMKELGESASSGFTEADEAALLYSIESQNLEKIKRYDRALVFEKKRLAIFEKQKKPMACRISMLKCGLLLYKQMDYRAAHDYFIETWNQSLKEKDNKGLLSAFFNSATVALEMAGRTGDSEFVEPALRHLEKTREALGAAMTPEIQITLSGTEGALKMAQFNAQNPFSQPLESPLHALEGLNNLAGIQSQFDSAYTVSRETRQWREQAIQLKNMAEVRQTAGDYGAAYDLLTSAEKLLAAHGGSDLLWRIHYAMANVIRDGGLSNNASPDALTLYEQAMDDLEAVPVEEETSDSKRSERMEKERLYLDAAQVMTDSGLTVLSLETIERGREKEIADLLAAKPPVWKRERHKVLWGNLRYVRTRLKELEGMILEEESGRHRLYELDRLNEEYSRYDEEYSEILSQIKEEDAVLAYLSGVYAPDVKAFQSILHEDEGALVYCSTSETTCLWAINQDEVTFHTIPVKQDSLKQRIASWLATTSSDSLNRMIGSRLYHLLIEPASGMLEDLRTVYLVPGKTLWPLPFEGLWDSEAYLIDSWTFSYAPSLTAFQLAYERRSINQNDLILFGDVRDDRLFDHTPNPSLGYKTYFGSRATESEIRWAVGASDLIHFERWLVPRLYSPFSSALVYFGDQKTDGFIAADDMFGWEAMASFVMLPSFRGSDPWDQRIDGFFYSLLYAGVPTMGTVAWPMPSDSREAFFKSFYSKISDLPLAEAMAETKIEIRDQKSMHWAAYRLLGFPGMDEEARLKFARSNLVSTVLKGRAYENQEDYSDAVRLYEKSLGMAEAIRDTTSMARIHEEIIRACQKGGEWDKAIRYQKEQMALGSSAQLSGEEEQSDRLVQFYIQSGAYQQAIEEKKQVLDRLKKQGDLGALASGMEELAFIYANAGKYDEALDWEKQALDLYQLFGQYRDEAGALIRMGRFYLENEQFFEARDALESGLAIFKSFDYLLLNTDIQFENASGYQLLGLAYDRLSRFEEAAESQEKGRAIFARINKPLQAAQGGQYLADLYWKSGDYRRALAFQEEALQVFEQHGDLARQSLAKSTLGLINMSLGDLKKATESEAEALALSRKSGRRADQATILKNLGLIAIQQNNLDKALQVFAEAAAIDSAIHAKRGLSYDYRNLGALQVRQGQITPGIATLQQALRLSEEAQDDRNQIQCDYELSKAWLALRKHGEAMTAIDRGLERVGDFNLPDVEWRLYRQKGKIYEEGRQPQKALDAYESALQIVEKMRAELKVEAFKQGFIDDKMDLYQDVIRLLFDMKQFEPMFSAVERAKSRNFIDLLGNQQVTLSGSQGKLLEQENQLRNAVDEAETRLSKLKNRESNDAILSEITAWEDSLNLRKTRYHDMIGVIQNESRELADFIQVDPWTVDQVKATLAPKTALIEYYQTAKELYILVVRSYGIYGERIAVTDSSVSSMVKKMRETIHANLIPDEESKALNQWLIAPVLSYLQGANHLVVVPHGSLHYLPFAAVMDETGSPLIERYALSFSPSATVMGFCLNKGEPVSEILPEPSVVAFGNPDLHDPNLDLPFAEKEVQSLERTFDHITPYFRDAVTETTVEEKAGPFDLIHFACHGVYDPEAPLFSALLLSPTNDTDGRLEAREIFSLRLHCALVTLSACETGLASITQGDEVIGLSRSFIFAGAPSIVTSLWKVDDLATAVMIKRFYRYLKAGYSRAEALRQAQLVVRQSVNAAPSAWAAFYLTGDYR